MLVVFGYPLLAEAALARAEPRGFAFGMLVLTCLGLSLRRVVEGRSWASLLTQAAPGLALLGTAALRNEAVALLLVPALVNAYAAFGFGWTLRGERSLVEIVASRMQPHLPDFVRPYCRRVTLLWTLFFAANALGIAALAAFSPEDGWPRYTARLYPVVVTALSLVEFLVRKLHFRNYSGGPLDRAFAALFPAENTAQGRRTAAYLDRMRELGIKTD